MLPRRLRRARRAAADSASSSGDDEAKRGPDAVSNPLAAIELREHSAADGDGRSVLWATCALRHLDVAAILARGACDVDAADADGDTALDFAVKHGHADVADFLRRRGAADRNAGRLSLSSSSNGGTSP